MKKAKGFTLIELMIVVAIIGILTSIAIPMFSDYSSRTRAAATMAELASVKMQINLCVHDGSNFQKCNGGSEGIIAASDFKETANTKKITSITAGVIEGESQASNEKGEALTFKLTPTMPANSPTVTWKVEGTICNQKRGIKEGCTF